MEWPVKRCYVGLGTVGVQEQAEDILVPPLLRNCLTLMTLPFLHSRTVVFAIALKLLLFRLRHCKNVYDDDDDVNM